MNFWNKFFRHAAVVAFLFALAIVGGLSAGFAWGSRDMGGCLVIALLAWVVYVVNDWVHS